MPDDAASRAFADLLALTRQLRSPGGCAWDRAQTIATIRPHLVEEFHECLEALDSGDDARFADELGDLLFLIVFMGAIAQDESRFSFEQVIRGITEKLRRRHPHVFGDATASTPDEVRSHWETTKLSEESHRSRESMLDGLPAGMPALLTARGDEGAATEGELGDLLFAVVNVARFLSIDPEAALRRTNRKFRDRFALIEERFRGRDLREVGLEEMDEVWDEAKERED